LFELSGHLILIEFQVKVSISYTGNKGEKGMLMRTLFSFIY